MQSQTKKTNLPEFDYKFGFSMPERHVKKTKRGVNEDIVREISRTKEEPKWMEAFRVKAYRHFAERPMPAWGADLSEIPFDDLTYFLRATEKQMSSWEDLPEEIRETYDRIGVPEAEKNFLAGVSAQYESEVVYESVNKKLASLGVLFCDMDTALRKYPDIVRKYFATLIPANDNKFAALNSAVWSGGSFVYVPKGVHVDLPLQAYFRINAESFGQFERTLIIAEEGSFVHYIEGCTAPIYRTQSLHSAVVEIFANPGARVRYTTVQNWSNNIYNLVTKRARAEENAAVEWIDCNIGSRVTMKYPSVVLAGRGSRGEVLSIAMAGKGQHQDTGAKMIHLAPETSSKVVSKSISKGGGRSSYRGLVSISPKAERAKAFTACDALILDDASRSDTYPDIQNRNASAATEHEATVEKIGEETLHYLRSRRVSEDEARGLIVNGFIEPIAREIPLEYSIELNRLINVEMEGSVG